MTTSLQHLTDMVVRTLAALRQDSSFQHAVVGYALGLGLLWGFALHLWWRHRGIK